MIRQHLGDLLVEQGYATPEQIQAALARQESDPQRLRLGRILVQEGVIDEGTLAAALAQTHGMSSVNLDLIEVDPGVARSLDQACAERHLMVPIESGDDHMTVAVADPVDVFALDDLRRRLPHHHLVTVVAPGEQIRRLLTSAWGDERHRRVIAKMADQAPTTSSVPLDADTESDEGAAALVSQLLQTAANHGASDIHIEPQSNSIRVRIRVDGILRDLMKLPAASLSSITARIKIISGLNVFDRRVPQDGRTRLRIQDHDRDIRVSTLPSIHGEKIVMRLLPTADRLPSLPELGLTPDQVTLLRGVLTQPQGLVLVTGPTGSGKSNTLYAGLVDTMDNERNVITIEDPVEVEITGITQVQINESVGLTFDNTLRAALRQDPDLLMVGEIRDAATGNLALRAALTGHMVMSTLHTLDAPGSVVRLLDLGLPPYLVAASLNLVVSQRLIRRNCSFCVVPAQPDPQLSGLLGIDPKRSHGWLAGSGCAACDYTGYRGRIGIFDILTITPKLRDAIAASADEGVLRAAAKEQGWRPLYHQGVRLVETGVTTPDELLRVVGVPTESDDAPLVPAPSAPLSVRPRAAGARNLNA